MTLTAVYMPVPEGYIGFVEEIPGANSQGETLDEVRDNLREAFQLMLEANRELAEQALVCQKVESEPIGGEEKVSGLFFGSSAGSEG